MIIATNPIQVNASASQAAPSHLESLGNASGSGSGNTLVLSSISQTDLSTRGFSGLLFYRNSLKVLKDSPSSFRKEKPTSLSDLAVKCEVPLSSLVDMMKEDPTRGKIDSFSIKSKARLQHVCLNSTCEFKSQMTLTYDGDSAPADGADLKADLNLFLTRMRKEFPGVKYVWVLEFQGNGNPHFHVFLNYDYSVGMARFIGHVWNVTVKGSEKHLAVHQYVPEHQYKRPLNEKDKHGSFCPWSMGDGSYITYKYLSKSSQKSVPAHFSNVGRFWGASRGIVNPIRAILQGDFESVFQDTINTLTGEVVTAQQSFNRFFRDLRKFHENRVKLARVKDHARQVARGERYINKVRKFRSPLRRICNAMINGGSKFF